LTCSETFSSLEDLAAFNAVMTVFNGVRKIVPVVQRVLEASRKLGLYVMHTREGHLPDLSDLPASKRLRQMNAPNGHHTTGIGEPGPMGRLLVRGEYGHDVIDELRPLPGEVIIDKPGKGSFWKTDFHRALLNRGITHLLLAGVTTEYDPLTWHSLLNPRLITR
jgi:nicotinamidase-related amidase